MTSFEIEFHFSIQICVLVRGLLEWLQKNQISPLCLLLRLLLFLLKTVLLLMVSIKDFILFPCSRINLCALDSSPLYRLDLSPFSVSSPFSLSSPDHVDAPETSTPSKRRKREDGVYNSQPPASSPSPPWSQHLPFQHVLYDQQSQLM